MNSGPGREGSPPARMFVMLMALLTSCSANSASFDAGDPASPVHRVREIPLPAVRGRIDHLALDGRTNHLFVAELTNGTVDDVDLVAGRVAGRIRGLEEPQGIAWLPAQDEVAVACGDGTVHFYRASDRREVATVQLGDDADNVRVDDRTGKLIVGYGSGALALIDPKAHTVQSSLKLPAHPEAFAMLGSRVLVNVPDRHRLVIGDLDRAQATVSLGTGTRFGNYPMALDPVGRRVAIGFRLPSSLVVLDAQSGATEFSTSICGDVDDLFFDSGQIIVICGEGAVDLVGTRDKAALRVATHRGARTGLFDERTRHLYIAVPAGEGTAAIWDLSVHSAIQREARALRRRTGSEHGP